MLLRFVPDFIEAMFGFFAFFGVRRNLYGSLEGRASVGKIAQLLFGFPQVEEGLGGVGVPLCRFGVAAGSRAVLAFSHVEVAHL